MSEPTVDNPPAQDAPDPFLDAAVDLAHLLIDPPPGRPGVLERLGPPSFRSPDFRFMGFLQTVYNQIAEHAAAHASKGGDGVDRNDPSDAGVDHSGVADDGGDDDGSDSGGGVANGGGGGGDAPGDHSG